MTRTFQSPRFWIKEDLAWAWRTDEGRTSLGLILDCGWQDVVWLAMYCQHCNDQSCWFTFIFIRFWEGLDIVGLIWLLQQWLKIMAKENEICLQDNKNITPYETQSFFLVISQILFDHARNGMLMVSPVY